MKYRVTEQVIVDTLNKEIKKLVDKRAKILDKKRRLDEEYESLRMPIFHLEQRITKMDERVQKRCKHKGERKYWANMRDDASFERYCACVDCDETLWDECK